jgi:chromate transporter
LTALATLYVLFGQIPWVNAAFLGIKAAVLVLVFEAVARLSKRAVTRGVHRIIAPAASSRLSSPRFRSARGPGGGATRSRASSRRTPSPRPRRSVRAPWPKVAGTAVTWIAIWLGPLCRPRGVARAGSHPPAARALLLEARGRDVRRAYAVPAYMAR